MQYKGYKSNNFPVNRNMITCNWQGIRVKVENRYPVSKTSFYFYIDSLC